MTAWPSRGAWTSWTGRDYHVGGRAAGDVLLAHRDVARVATTMVVDRAGGPGAVLPSPGTDAPMLAGSQGRDP